MFLVSSSTSEFQQSETNNLKLETRDLQPETLARDTLHEERAPTHTLGKKIHDAEN